MSVENGKDSSLNGKFNGKGDKGGDVSIDKKVELTDIFGGFGRFQILLGGIVMVSTILGNWNVIGYTFFTYPMDHWCARPEKYANISVEKWKNLTIPKEMHHGVQGFSQCKMYDISNYSSPDLLMSSYENRDFSVEWKASSRVVGCGELEFDKSFFQSTILYQWSITCENSWLASLSQSVYMAGFLIAVLGFGQIGDKFGRRPVLLTCVALQQVAGFAAAFSPNFIFFVIMRFFIAMGTHGFYTTGFVVLMELVSAEMRPKMGVILSVGWSVGFILLPGLGWLTRNWSTMQLVIAICSMSLSVCWWFFPESPRWLVTQGKYKEAKKIIEKAAKTNKMYTDETPKMIERFCELVELDKQLNSIESIKTQKASIIDLVRTPNMRKTTLNMFFAWFVTSFVYYGLSLNTHSLGGDPIVNIAIAGATEFPCLVVGYLAITYIGRRKPLTFFLVLAGGGCLLTIPITDDLLWLRITLVMIGKAGVSIAFGIVYIFSAELFPTVVRNVGVGSSSTCARIGSIIAPFVKELGKATTEGVPLAVFGGVTVFSGLLVLLLPETRNKPIPDTLEEGEIASTKKRKHQSSRKSSGDFATANQAFQTEEAKL